MPDWPFTVLMLILALALAPGAPARADLVMVVNARSGVSRLSQDEAVDIFMGRYRQLPSGQPALPVDLPAADPDRGRFYRLLLNKDLAEVNAYWARLVFSGKARPPRQADSSEAALDWLVRQPGAIGYLDRKRLDHRLRVVLELEPGP